MRFGCSAFLFLFFPVFVFAQNNDVFKLNGQPGLAAKDEAIIQMVPLDNGNRVLVVGKSQLQVWDVPNAKLIDSSPHKITGYWYPDLLMRIASFPKPMNFPLAMNENRMTVSPDGARGITLAKPPDEKSKEKSRSAVVWNLKTGETVGTLARGVTPTREARFSDDGSTIMTVHGDVKDTELAFWEPASLSLRSSIKVRDLSFHHLSRDGERVFVTSGEANKWVGVTIMSFDTSNGIEVWNTRTGKLEKTYADGNAKFSMAEVTPDDQWVAALSHGNLVVWEANGDGTPKYRFTNNDPKRKFAIRGSSADSRYLLVQQKTEALIYDLRAGTLYRRVPIREEYSFTLSPDSRFVILRSEGLVAAYHLEKEKFTFVYDIKTDSEERLDDLNEEWEIERPIVSPDSKFMLIDGRDDVRIYDLATGELVQTLIDPQRAKYDKNKKLKKGGLDTSGGTGWLASGNAIYRSGPDGRSFYLWNRK